MDYGQSKTLLDNAVKGFHGRFKKMYGQICLRVDDDTYISTGGNKILSDIRSEDYALCDITVGDLSAIFAARPDLNAIIFGCSPDTVEASSQSDRVLSSLEDIAMLAGPAISVISNTAPESMLAALAESNVCLIKGVGALAACTNLKKAVAAIQIVEKACEAENHGKMLGGAIALSKEEALACRKSFQEDYTKRNEESHVEFIGFDEAEFAMRSDLIEYGKDLVRKDLSYGSWGNLSVKLNKDEMLITPSSMDYFEIKPEDIVRVNIHTLDYGDQRVPSSEAPMHAAIYRSREDAGAIIHTHSNGVSVFAACEAGFVIKDPTLHELVGDILVCKKAVAGSELLATAVAETMESTHACIIPHHGAVFYGPSLDLVFAISESVELKARNLLMFDSIDSYNDVLDD